VLTGFFAIELMEIQITKATPLRMSIMMGWHDEIIPVQVVVEFTQLHPSDLHTLNRRPSAEWHVA
jgi:hypothetical protein